MRIACLGGGPAGLYFAISMKLRNQDHDIVVFERNRPDDTFGFGVVFSDATLEDLARTRPSSGFACRRTTMSGPSSSAKTAYWPGWVRVVSS